MYLFIFEGGEVRKGTTFGDDDVESCDAGILDVIDISGEQPKQYHENSWHDIEEYKKKGNFYIEQACRYLRCQP